MRRAGGVVVGLLLVLVARASAQTRRCESAETQADLNRCAREASTVANGRLVELLQALHATLDSSRIPGLDSAENAWEGYRRAHCSWVADEYQGGSMQPLILSTCWTDLTEHRIAELKVALCVGDPEPECEASRRFDVPRTSRRRS